MIQTTTYSLFELTDGVYPCCSKESGEIYINDPDGRCIDCIHDEDFYEMSMNEL